MRPLRLTIQAFGPYASREVVDFRMAVENGLFGIYGATGSGKSSIFSAMTFALFGEATRAEQHTTSLRSDHADPNLMTEVELVFEARGKQYRVLRRPEQMRPQKRSGGETKELHKAWLFDVTGLDLDTVSDANPGKAIAETKVADVKREVEKVLGYGATQFRQIVLLPQGRFETFLTASTDDRLKILRDLFDVTLYRRVTEELKERGQKAAQDISTARAVCDQRLKAEEFQTRDELMLGIEQAKETLALKTEEEAKAKAIAEAAGSAYARAAETDKAFKEHIEAERVLAALLARKPEIDALETRLARARRSETVLPLSDAVVAAKQSLAAEDAKAHLASDAKTKAEAAAATAIASLKALKAKASDVEALRVAHADLRRHEAALVKSEALAAELKAADEKARTAASAEEALKARIHDLSKAQSDLQRAIEAARAADETRSALKLEEHELRRERDGAEHHEKARALLSDAVQQLADADATAKTAEADKHRTEQDAAKAEAELLKSHAAHLAKGLSSGEPCPVCGSETHPALAKGAIAADAETLTQAFERARKAHTAAIARSADADAKRDAALALKAERESTFKDTAAPARPLADISSGLARIDAALKALAPAGQRVELDEKLSKAAEAFKAAEAERATKAAAAQAAQLAAALARQTLDQALIAIPEALRTKEALATAVAKQSHEIAAFDAALKDREAAERSASEALITAQSEATHAASLREAANARLKDAETALSSKLLEHGLDANAFEASKPDIPRIAAFASEMALFGEKIAIARARVDAATTAIASVDRPDLAALLGERDATDAAAKLTQRASIVASQRVLTLEKLADDLRDELARLDALEKETAPIRELADLCAGRTAAKIDLETFAIATMFDHVLEAANLRLSPMTRGRYRLVRDDQGRGNARRGLGIAVDDTYTGRQRATETLSGGETFIAALALALGLSDVVESTDGSIRLDTIFIDEGFGSLDSESDAGTLEQVLDTLETLAAGTRAIGIISHVPLVQQAIPNGFWITKTATGSHIEVRA